MGGESVTTLPPWPLLLSKLCYDGKDNWRVGTEYLPPPRKFYFHDRLFVRFSGVFLLFVSGITQMSLVGFSLEKKIKIK